MVIKGRADSKTSVKVAYATPEQMLWLLEQCPYYLPTIQMFQNHSEKIEIEEVIALDLVIKVGEFNREMKDWLNGFDSCIKELEYVIFEGTIGREL